MSQELRSLSALSPRRCIYRVPKRLREGNEKAYTPQVVSIGPLHHDDEQLKAMEEHKMRYVQDLLRRNKVSWERCIKTVKDQEDRLRSCYAAQTVFTSDNFVRLVLVDALFLIELLLRDGFEELRRGNDYIFGPPWIINDLWSDLVMLENQLPFFILEYLWEAAARSPNSMLEHAYSSFRNQIYRQREGYSPSRLEVKHFVDVIRNLCLPEIRKSPGKYKSIPSTTQLHLAGVKFKERSTHNLLDIHFDKDKGVLEIPKLRIGGFTETTIRNLVAYEQCHYFDQAYICHYVFLMNDFLNTPKDVELLGEYKILNDFLGDSNQVSTLINYLGKGVIPDYNHFYFATICDDLYSFCGTRWHKWKANVRKNYLTTPCAVISVVPAILLMVLTIIQTICSMCPLLKQQPCSK